MSCRFFLFFFYPEFLPDKIPGVPLLCRGKNIKGEIAYYVQEQLGFKEEKRALKYFLLFLQARLFSVIYLSLPLWSEGGGGGDKDRERQTEKERPKREKGVKKEWGGTIGRK